MLALASTAPGSAFAQSRPDGSEPSNADIKRGDAAFAAGRKAFEKKKFKVAAEKFRVAFEAEPSKPRLFAWAQAERFAKNCYKAYFNYARLLRLNPTAKQLEPVQYGMRACEKNLNKKQITKIRTELDELERVEREREKAEALRRQREELEEQRAADERRRRERAEKRRREREQTLALLNTDETPDEPRSRIPAYVLMGAGGLALAGGGVSLFLARRYNDREADTFQDRLDDTERAETYNLLSTIGFASGGALAGAGLIYFFLSGGSAQEPRTGMLIESGPGDVGFAVSGRF